MLDGMVILNAPTSVSWTGGTAVTFESDGSSVANGTHIVDTSATDWRTQSHITYKSRRPVVQGDGSFSKARREGVFTLPFILADGTVSYQVVRISIEAHPEFAAIAGNISRLRHFGGQMFLDSETDDFFNVGSTK